MKLELDAMANPLHDLTTCTHMRPKTGGCSHLGRIENSHWWGAQPMTATWKKRNAVGRGILWPVGYPSPGPKALHGGGAGAPPPPAPPWEPLPRLPFAVPPPAAPPPRP